MESEEIVATDRTDRTDRVLLEFRRFTKITFSNLDTSIMYRGKFRYKDFIKDKDKLLLTMEPVIIDSLSRLTEDQFPSAIYGEKDLGTHLRCTKETKYILDGKGKVVLITFTSVLQGEKK